MTGKVHEHRHSHMENIQKTIKYAKRSYRYIRLR